MQHILRCGMAMLLFISFSWQNLTAQSPTTSDIPNEESTGQNLPPILYSSGSGQWNTPNFWSDGNGTFYTNPDDPTVDIVIQAGHTVTVTVGSKSCKNLTVTSGASLVASGASNRYINVFGSSVDLAGTVGGPGNGLSFNLESTNCTLSAIGNVDLSRLRKNVSGNSTQLLFLGQMNLHYNGAALTNQAIGTRFDIQVNGALTVSAGDISLDGVDGTNSVNHNGSITINGVVEISQGNLYATTDNSAGQDIRYQINNGGQLIVGGQIIGNSGVSNAATAEIVNQGSLILQAPGTVFSNLDLVRNLFTFSQNALTQYNGAAAIVESILPYGELSITGGTASINGPTIVGRQLSLFNSILQLGDFDLSMAPNASIQNIPADMAYVQTNGLGYLRQTVGNNEVFFPVGNSTLNPVHLTTSGGMGIYQVRVLDEVLSNGWSGNMVQDFVVNRTWLIEEQSSGGALQAEVFWLPSHEGGGFDRQQCYISHYQAPSWQSDVEASAQSSSLYPGFYSRTRININSLSPFSVGSSGILPAEWGAFYLEQKEQNIHLKWNTLQETQTDFFTIEWSLNGGPFRDIGRLDAAGFSTNPQYYFFEHLRPGVGHHYYRIRLQDIDGTQTWSSIAQTRIIGGDLFLFPIPAQDHIYLQMADTESVDYQIYDQLGRLQLQGRCNDPSIEAIRIELLASGKYYLKTKHGQMTTFIKN